MPKRPDFLPVETAKGWMVSIPPGMTADGKRVRRFFQDKKKAEKLAGALRAQHHSGVRGSVLPSHVAQQAMEALKILQPVGLSLMEAARMAAAQLGGEEQREIFRERLKRVWLDGEVRWSDRYERDMQKIPRWIGEEGMGMRVGELTEEVVARLLRQNGAAAQSTFEMRRLRVLAALHWKVRHRRGREVEVMTAAQMTALMGACKTVEERRAVGLLLYAGIRPDAEDGEIMRMDWSMVGETEIYLPPRVSKTKTDRHVPVTPRLREMLVGHPPTGRVAPANWKRTWQRLRKAAGIAEHQDLARHTFASHFLAAHGEEATKQAMGHTAGSRVLFDHYRRAVTQAAGLAYFE